MKLCGRIAAESALRALAGRQKANRMQRVSSCPLLALRARLIKDGKDSLDQEDNPDVLGEDVEPGEVLGDPWLALRTEDAGHVSTRSERCNDKAKEGDRRDEGHDPVESKKLGVADGDRQPFPLAHRLHDVLFGEDRDRRLHHAIRNVHHFGRPTRCGRCNRLEGRQIRRRGHGYRLMKGHMDMQIVDAGNSYVY